MSEEELKRMREREIINETSMNLLMSVMDCGYRDLERLTEVLKIAEKLHIEIGDIIKYTEDITTGKRIKFNNLIYSVMRLILDKIADIVGEKDEDLAEKIRDQTIFINYMDSWFNISSLDRLRDFEEIEKISKQEIVKRVVEYFKGV